MPYNADNALHTFNFNRGFNAGMTRLAVELSGYAAEGSANAKYIGAGYYEPFEGVQSLLGAGSGSRIMKPIGNTWGGIKDIGPTLASGSVSEEIGRSLWGIGSGQVHIGGTDVTGFTLSTLLKLVLRSAGVYGSPFTAGLAQPSRVELGVLTTSGSVDGAISAKIERWRPATGGRSLASLTSEVVVGQGNKIRATFPIAITGQTHWRIYFTLMRFGGQGIHYALPYNAVLDIPEATIAASTVDGIARTLEFDWKDGDLQASEASYDDYSPAAATHSLRLEQCMLLAGAYSDSTASPTTTSTGVAIQVSKDNNYESYVPTHLLFLPERVVDTMSRPIDSYGFILCENSTHVVQYVGPREDLPSCTITTPLPDIGALYPHNWCQFKAQICIYSAEGNLVMISEDGTIDTEFAAPVRSIMRDWLPEDTVTNYDPKNDCLVVMNGLQILMYSLQNLGWSLPIHLEDYGGSATQEIRSAQNANRKLMISIESAGVFSAHEFDKLPAGDPIPLSFVGHYTGSPAPGASKNIYQVGVSVETNEPASNVVLAINRNLQTIAFRGASATAASNVITDAQGRFRVGMNGKRLAIFGNGIGGAFNFLIGFISYVNKNTIDLIDELGAPILVSIAKANALVYIGDYVEYQQLGDFGSVQLPDFFPNVTECKSYSVAVNLESKSEDPLGCVLEVNVYGSGTGTGRTP